MSFEGTIGLKLSPSVAAGFVHFVVALPGELNRIAVAGTVDGAGDAAEGELAAALAVEQNVGWFDHVGVVGRIIRHLDDAPFALHVAAPKSLGRRIRL